MNQAEQLQQVAKDIIRDQVCPALAKTATQLVLGEGNPNADIVIIGEAPGQEEDRLGRPFVGASGKFLDEMLASISLARADVYITNIVKYRPPNNRDPEPGEKKAFRPYLDRQIAIIQPQILVTLGKHSLNEFLPDGKISRIHGVPQTNHTPPVFPLYHPAAALYTASLRPTLLEDFAKLKAFVDNRNN